MKLPAINPEGYRRTSTLTYAARLARPLLVIDSLANATPLIEASARSGHPIELVALAPTDDPALAAVRETAQVDFFRRQLVSRSR
jgi:hypothetical protein